MAYDLFPSCIALSSQPVKVQADVTRPSSVGFTPLHCLAVSRPRTQQHHGYSDGTARQRSLGAVFEFSVGKIADALLEAGAAMDAADNNGNTPLFTAVTSGCSVLCEQLLARGADANARSVNCIRPSFRINNARNYFYGSDRQRQPNIYLRS